MQLFPARTSFCPSQFTTDFTSRCPFCPLQISSVLRWKYPPQKPFFSVRTSYYLSQFTSDFLILKPSRQPQGHCRRLPLPQDTLDTHCPLLCPSGHPSDTHGTSLSLRTLGTPTVPLCVPQGTRATIVAPAPVSATLGTFMPFMAPQGHSGLLPLALCPLWPLSVTWGTHIPRQWPPKPLSDSQGTQLPLSDPHRPSSALGASASPFRSNILLYC